jgi:hypothetical protein
MTAQATMRWDMGEVLGLKVVTRPAPRWNEGDGEVVEGVLERVDRRTGSLVARIEKDGKFESRVFESALNFGVSLVDGRGDGINDLLPGMRTTLYLARRAGEVVRVKAEPTTQGILKEVDWEKATLTLMAANGEGERTFTLETDARLMIFGWPCDLLDFQPGFQMRLVIPNNDGRVTAAWTLDGP